MAILLDKLFNRKIEGELLELSEEEKEKLGLGNVFSVAVSDITNISNSILSKLKAGDIVLKITGKQKHTYVVSYKGEGAGEGICLTYTDASCVETVSYDRSGSSWVYNSTDITPLGVSGGTKLYKHEFSFAQGTNTYISTTSTPIINSSALYNDFKVNCVKMLMGLQGSGYPVLNIKLGQTDSVFYIKEDGTINSANIPDTFTDTVTPL